MTFPPDRENDDDVAPEVQENSDVETEEYPGMLEDLEEDEPTKSVDVDTEDEDDDHADSI